MALPQSFYSMTLNDNTVTPNGNPERTTWQVAINTLTAANLVAQTALIDTLQSAALDLLLGTVYQETTTVKREFVTDIPPSSTYAQRENKLLVRYHDSVTQRKFQVALGTFNLNKLMPNSEFVDLNSGDGAAFKAAFEDVVVSPDDASHSVVVDSAQFVGRNS